MLLNPHRFGTGGGSARVAPTWEAVGTHTAGSITAAYPAGIVAGEYLELTVVANGAGADTAYSLAGWTAGASVHADWGSNMLGLYILWKVADGTETGSVTPTRTGTAPTREGAVIDRYSGVDTSGSPYEGSNTGNTPNSTTTPISTTAVTTTGSGRLVVNKLANQIAATLTPETGWTEAWDLVRSGVGPDYGFAAHHKVASGAGAQETEEPTPSAEAAFAWVSYALIGLP